MDKVYFKIIFPDSIEKLHHAYCLEGGRENILNGLLGFLEHDLKFKIKGNPDFYFGDFDALGIDEGRSVNEMQMKKPISFSRRIFLIMANSLTREAQNSLLKMFEEPAGGAVFILIIPSASIILPTLRSRMMIVNLNNGATRKENDKLESPHLFDARKFIRSAVAERLEIVKKICDKISDEEISRSAVTDFINSVEREILNRSETEDLKIKNTFTFEEINKCRDYSRDRSPSVKMLLEHMAMVL